MVFQSFFTQWKHLYENGRYNHGLPILKIDTCWLNPLVEQGTVIHLNGDDDLGCRLLASRDVVPAGFDKIERGLAPAAYSYLF